MCPLIERHNLIRQSVTLPPLALPCLQGLKAVDNNSWAGNQAPHELQCRARLSRSRAVFPWITAKLRVRSGDMIYSRPPS